MKNGIILLALIFLIVFDGTLAVSGKLPAAQKTGGENAAKTDGQPTWEIPIAAGVWYPTDGPVPEKPARYYRVRCWPGCHTGSTYGKYPDKSLHDKPIFPTSTINVHSGESSRKE